ncbi:MAG: hypothetical protein C0469_00915 [Cyanobacteria bacterium DS2.3.42]|nr:hypothetical protein [Cyanobacteria bacterium DS2.3.42]
MPEPSTNSESSTITIAVANASKDNWEWKCLLSTLDKVGWQIRNNKIQLLVFGKDFGFDCNTPVYARFLGISTEAKTIEMLSTAQIMYCSQKFEPKFAEQTRTHFPPELSLLLRSGRPLVFHGPDYAAPVSFLKSQNAAVFCHSCESIDVELYNSFDRLIFDLEHYDNIAANGLRAAQHELITSISEEQLLECVKAIE